MKLLNISKTLNSFIKKDFSKKLHIYEGDRYSTSGVRATIFGATGFVGKMLI
jgi:hypothetical protein